MTLYLVILFILISGWFTGLEIALLQADKVELCHGSGAPTSLKFHWFYLDSEIVS